MKIFKITFSTLALLSLLLFTAGCGDPCDDLPDFYAKADAEYLPYEFFEQLVFEDSVGNIGTGSITYFNKYPAVEEITDCAVNTEYVEAKIKLPELNSNGANIELTFNVKEQTDIELGNDMKFLNYIPSDNAEIYYGASVTVLGKTFNNIMGLRCKDSSCGTVLELIFAKEKGLVAYRTLSGWKAIEV